MSKADKKNIHNKIYKKVSQYIFNYGLKGWNMDQLAAETGMAKNTLYKIIGYKEDMIREVYLNKIKSIHNNLSKLINKDSEYFETLHQLGKIFLDIVKYTETRQAREIFLEYPAVENEVNNIKDQINNKIIIFLNKGIKNNYLKKDKEGRFYFELILALAFYYIKENDNINVEQTFQKALESLIIGIKK